LNVFWVSFRLDSHYVFGEKQVVDYCLDGFVCVAFVSLVGHDVVAYFCFASAQKVGYEADFCSIFLLDEKPLFIFHVVVESFQLCHGFLFGILELAAEVDVVVPFEKQGQVLFLDYSELDISAFKQRDLPIHAVPFVSILVFLIIGAALNIEVTPVRLSVIYSKMSLMSEPEKVGPALVVSILREAKRPLTTKELSVEVHRRVPRCVSDNIVVLNLMRIRGSIKGRRVEGSWVWWVEDKEQSK
jgi:hypothetical protein